jgi:hypothetical protein
MFTDLIILYKSGAQLWGGQYLGLYPLPANGFFALLSLVPFDVAGWLLLSVSILALVATLKREAVLWVMYYPILANLWLGQVDLIALWLLRHASPVSLALLTLKPHLFLLAIPTLWKDRKLWKPFLFWVGVLYVPITIVRPGWVMEWLTHMNDGRQVAGYVSLLQVPLLAFLVLACLSVTKKLTLKRVFWSFNPVLRWYDFTMLAGGSKWLIPVSWVLSLLASGKPWLVSLLGLM